MKSLAFSSESRRAPRERLSSVKRTLAGTVAGLSFLFAPVAQRALAQPAAKEQLKPGYKISGTKVRINGNTAQGYLSRGDKPAIITLDGPTELNVAVYPIVKSYTVPREKGKEIQIAYMLDGILYQAKAKLSNLAETELVAHDLKKAEAICDAVMFRIAVPEGKHQFHIISHDAVLEVGDDMGLVNLFGKTDESGVILAGAPEMDEQLELVPLVPPEPVKKTTPAPEKKKPEEKPVAKPEIKPETKPKPELIIKPEPKINPEPKPAQALKPSQRLLGLRGKRFDIGGLNNGDVNEIELLATPRVSDLLAIAAGSNLSSHARTLELHHFRQTMRSFSANLEAGIGLFGGSHNAFLVLFGGVRKTGGMLTLDDGRTDPLELMQAEYGARAGYDYNGLFGVRVRGSNNPFSPARVEIYASLPYWYLEDNFPMLTADVMWLNHLREKAVEGIIGKTSLDVTDIKTRLMLSVPLARLGPIVPTALGGVDLSTAEGLKVSGHAGGALGAEFLDTVKIEAGAAYGFDGSLLILLNGRLLH